MRTPTWTAAITSPTACRTRWTGCDSAAGWLRQLDGGGYPPAVNLRPSADWPDRAVVIVDLARVQAIIDRIAADVDELARAWRAGDLDGGGFAAADLPGCRAPGRGTRRARVRGRPSGVKAAAHRCAAMPRR
jgi:hypothetical protein